MATSGRRSDRPRGPAARAGVLSAVAACHYAAGAGAGALLHAAKARLGSAEGRRLAAAAKSGRFAALTGAAFLSFDFLFASLRGTREEDAVNMGLAGAATVGLGMASHGPLVAAFSSVAAGAVCAAVAKDLYG